MDFCKGVDVIKNVNMDLGPKIYVKTECILYPSML